MTDACSWLSRHEYKELVLFLTFKKIAVAKCDTAIIMQSGAANVSQMRYRYPC